MEAEVKERIVVRGSRIEYAVHCDWCAGHGYEPTEYMTIEPCAECHGSGFKFQHVMEADNGN
jgi:DnaJ-class molecular chaperone